MNVKKKYTGKICLDSYIIVEVFANNEEEAEELMYKKFEDGYYDGNEYLESFEIYNVKQVK